MMAKFQYGIMLKFPASCWVDLDVFLFWSKSSSWSVINCIPTVSRVFNRRFQGVFAYGSNGPGGDKCHLFI